MKDRGGHGRITEGRRGPVERGWIEGERRLLSEPWKDEDENSTRDGDGGGWVSLRAAEDSPSLTLHDGKDFFWIGYLL